MKKLIGCLMILFISNCLKGQYNMVLNPSFEDHDTCLGAVNSANFWSNPLTSSSPNYMNACNPSPGVQTPKNNLGYQVPRTGNAYMHIATYAHGPNQLAHNFREYIQGTLSDSLIAGVSYCIRFFTSQADSANYCSNNIGIFFSPVSIQQSCIPFHCVLPFVPQFENSLSNSLCDRNVWTEISGSFTANGGEKYFIIGNFRDSAVSSATYTWVTSNHAYDCAGYYIDDVLITPCDSWNNVNDSNNEAEIEFYQNSDSQLFFTSVNLLIIDINIYNSLGQNVQQIKNRNSKKISIDVGHYNSGIYMINVTSNKGNYVFKFIKN